MNHLVPWSELIVDILLLVMLILTAIGMVRLKNLFATAMLSGIYSLVSAVLFVLLDAVDVAFTEAAVGAGIAGVLMLGTLSLVDVEEKTPKRKPWLPLILVVITGGVLVYGVTDLPSFGNPQNPIHQHVAPRYIQTSPEEIGVPNMVTSVLASYRGFDTFGETTVVMTALTAVFILLGSRRRKASYSASYSASEGVKQ